MMHYLKLIKLSSLILLFAGFFGIGCGHSSPDAMITNDSNMSLFSSAFSNAGSIPVTYCYNDGSSGPDFKNYSPPLQWTGTPASAKSQVILAWCDNDGSSNWVLYMPGSSAASLVENASASGSLPAGSIQGKNRYGTNLYAGPYPYSDVESYDYVFAVFALDSELSVSSSSTMADVQSAMNGHIIGSGYITGSSTRMILTSNGLSDGGAIPVKYAYLTSSNSLYSSDYYNYNSNPDFTWSNAPSNTRSFTLIVEDQDGNTNWIVYNIAAINTSIPEGSDNARPNPPGSTFGTNDYDIIDYIGPTPASGQLMTYYFRLYALDTVLDEQALGHAYKDQILAAMQGHIISEASISGKFIRLELNSTGRTYSDAYHEYIWDNDYYYRGIFSSINPPFTWNSSGIPAGAVSMVLLGTKMVNYNVADATKTWVLYIPQINPHLYSITEGCSWDRGLFPGNWVQAMTDRSKESDAPNFGYDGFVYYSNSTGRPHPYRFGLYVLASTLGITYNDTYDSVIEALESATVLNKAFAGGYYLNRLP
ncbi:MAG TPA: YbhB/YbcL family Raf kinase inhibitor-like protein [Desulfomonilia bacterium]